MLLTLEVAEVSVAVEVVTAEAAAEDAVVVVVVNWGHAIPRQLRAAATSIISTGRKPGHVRIAITAP